MKTSRSPAPHARLTPPWVRGTEPSRVLGLAHAVVALPPATSTTRSDHGRGWRSRIVWAGPPAPGWLTYAIRDPSGDHTGELTRSVLGASHRIGLLFPVKRPSRL